MGRQHRIKMNIKSRKAEGAGAQGAAVLGPVSKTANGAPIICLLFLSYCLMSFPSPPWLANRHLQAFWRAMTGTL